MMFGYSLGTGETFRMHLEVLPVDIVKDTVGGLESDVGV